MKKLLGTTFILCTSVCCVRAQRTIHGRVFGGQSNDSPVDSVKLFTSSGNITFTDKLGNYQISVKEKSDTLFVQYKDRMPIHFIITQTGTPDKFDIYLNNPDYFKNEIYHELKSVEVHTRNYHDDSLAMREKYNDIFKYEKPTFKYGKDWIIIPPIFASVDVDNLIRLTQIQRTKRKLRNKRFALQSEEDLYIDNRFSKSLAGRITHLDDNNELFKFMEWCRPTAQQLRMMNDLELSQYILDNYKEYEKCKVKR